TLPSKYEALFRNLIKFYEEKQYQTALSYADNILRDYPQHGDTMAMKALLTRYLKEQEINKHAYNMVKKALEYVNNKSFICWHVYGLMYKEDFKISQAITCFQNSLKFNPTNEIQAWRELSNVQIHSRDYKGAIESRRKLIELKPGIGAFWLGYAVAQHLSGNLTGAIQTIDKYMTALFEQSNKDSKNYKFEKSELLLYLAQMMYENGQYKECADSLLANTKFLADELSTLELLADCYIKLNQLDHAKKIALQLIKKNSEDYSYYGKYQLACGFNTSENRFLLDDSKSNNNQQEEVALKLFEMYTTSEDLKEFREKSPVLKMIILSLCPPYNNSNDERFKKELNSFVEPYFTKTIPSLFKTLKSIYQKQTCKIALIEQAMLERMNQEESNTTSNTSNTSTTTTNKDPTILLWIYVYLSQHYDAIHQYDKALEYVNRAIEHTPTLIELYMLKAKFYKHLFNTEQAALCMEQARLMDLSDRYLNTKATKYWTRHDEIEEEEKDSNLIPIEDGAIYHRNNVHDMQCLWFENECGDAHYRKGELSMAVRRYYYTVQHFMEMYEDQFDFHTYSIRKMTLRSYIEMMKYYDKLYSQYFYFH
ncbi:predicted protein, partial [Naegleria gruberi]